MGDAKLAPIVRTRVNNALYRYMNRNEAFNRKGRDGVRMWTFRPETKTPGVWTSKGISFNGLLSM